MTTFRVIGPGRAGRSLMAALDAVGGYRSLGAWGRDRSPVDAARGVDLLVIATPDDAVAEVAAAGAPGGDHGGPPPVGLARARRPGRPPPAGLAPPAGAAAQRRPSAPSACGSGITFAVAGDPAGPGRGRGPGRRVVEVDDGDRAAYHAAACIAANHLVALIGQVERVAATAGLPLDAFAGLMRAATDDALALGPRRGADRPGRPGRLGDRGAPPRRHRLDAGPPDRAGRLRRHGGAGPAALARHGRGPRRRRWPASAPPARRSPRPWPPPSRWRDHRRRPPGPPPPASTVVDTLAGFAARLDDARRAGPHGGRGADHGRPARRARRPWSSGPRAECDVVAVSIFVNPTQFGDAADLADYPRTLDADLAVAGGGRRRPGLRPVGRRDVPGLAGAAGHHRVGPGPGRPLGGRVPARATSTAWPPWWSSCCRRPGRCRAYFGEKDFQQLAVVRRVVGDLSLPARGGRLPHGPRARRPGPVEPQRPPDAAERAAAAGACHRALARRGRRRWPAAATGPTVEAAMAAVVADEPLVDLDYAVLVDADDLEPADDRRDRPSAAAAGRRPVGPGPAHRQPRSPPADVSAARPSEPGAARRPGAGQRRGRAVGRRPAGGAPGPDGRRCRRRRRPAGRRADQGRAVPVGHPVGPGRRGRRARRRRGLDRPPPGRHPGRRRRPVRRRRRAGPGRRGARPGSTSSSPWAPCSTASPAGRWPWPARAGTRRPGWSTPGAPPPAPRSSGPWSTPPGPRPPPCSRSGSPSTCWSRAGGAAGVLALSTDGPAGRGPGHPHGAGHRRRRPALRGHHQPGRGHRRRPGHGPAGRGGRGRRRVHAVPPDRAPPPGHAPAAALRGAARARRPAARRPRRAVRRRAGPAGRGQPGHGRADARPGGRQPVAGRHRPRLVRRPVPDHQRLAGGHRPRSRRPTGCPSPRPPTTCRAAC